MKRELLVRQKLLLETGALASGLRIPIALKGRL